MNKFLKSKKIKRFKIVEQIIIVLFLAVIVPLVISAVIINNINQHSVRNELRYSALIISESIASNIETFFQTGKDELDGVILALKYIKSDYAKEVYLKDMLLNSEVFESFDVVDINDNSLYDYGDSIINYDGTSGTVEVVERINQKQLLKHHASVV